MGCQFFYTVLDDGTAKIYAYDGDLSKVHIPSEVNGYTVTAIGKNAFYHCTMTSVTVPETVTTIGYQAFVGCEKLTSVTLPEGLESIGGSAFLNCYALTSINIPSTVTSIGEGAFNFCPKLTSIVLPEGITEIESFTFARCTSLKTVTIPASVKAIGEYVFYKNHSVDLIVERGSYAEKWARDKDYDVAYIEKSTGISQLLTLLTGDSEAAQPLYEYSLLDDGTAKLTAYTGSDADLVIPAEIDGHPVTVIGEGVFAGHHEMRTLTIPIGIVTIEARAFANCVYLTEIELPGTLRSIGASAFIGCPYLTSVTIPWGVVEIGEYAFTDVSYASSIVIPYTVKQIGDGAFTFSYGYGTTNYVYRNSYAEDWVDDNLYTYEYIVGLLYELQEDGTAMITGASGDVEEWVIPAEIDGYSVTAIGKNAFFRCYKMKRLVIPSSVTHIYNNAINHCDSLKTIAVERGSYAGCWARRNNRYSCEYLTSDAYLLYGEFAYCIQEDATIRIIHYSGESGNVEIPSSIDGMPVTAIDDYAFTDVVQNSVSIPETVTSIGTPAFSSSTSRGGTFPVITVTPGSYAEEWAKANNLSVVYPEE